MTQRYSTSAALRKALEDRLKTISAERGGDLQRLRRQVAFDRLLCRLFHDPESPWLLKGGYAMELRIHSARTTRDIDLALRHFTHGGQPWNAQAVRDQLSEAAGIDLSDGFSFAVGEPGLDLDAAPYGGSRYPIEARMAARKFVSFHLDVSAGDVLREPFEMLEGTDWLGFAGIERATVPAVSSEEQFAEKLHAYTLPRTDRVNTRVKDLVDMVLLMNAGTLNAERLTECVQATFRRRGTHDVPSTQPDPPATWGTTFHQLAGECGLETDMMEHHRRLARFLNGIL